ncbi:MAG: acyl-CoA dehydrogenase family protein, partial [Sphingomonadales bacterium]
MDFELNEDQRAFQDMAAAFTAEHITPHAAKWDEEKIFPKDVLRKAADLGLAAIYVGEEYGGSGLTRVDAALVFEQLAMGCPSTAAFLSIHNMVNWMVDAFGDDKARARWVPELSRMDLIASYCLTEPNAGSDAAALSTKAVREGDEYVLNGSKAFISGAGEDGSDIFLAMVLTGGEGPKGISALMIEKGRAGLSFGAQERKLGWRCQPTAMVNFDNCRVPVSNRIGDEGEGFKIAMQGLDGGRLNIGAC